MRNGLGLALVWSFVAFLPFSTALYGQQEAGRDELLVKLRELEKRLIELERKQAAEEGTTEAQPAEKEAAPEMTVEVQELRRQLGVLAEEVEKLRSGEQDLVISAERIQALGLGVAAASVYRKRQGVSIAGYGEMLYENFDATDEAGRDSNKTTQLDFLRNIIYAGYRFNDKFLFNSEIEFEHASTGKAGEASVELAYIDYLANPNLTLRGGLVLVPMGLINEFHEPTSFVGARRTETETRIIPSTWRENGAGVLGSYGKFDFRAYVINGLNAQGFDSNGIRGGRQKGSKAKASDLAFVGRVDFNPTPGVFFGGSIYRGGADHGELFLDGQELDVTNTIGEIHGQARIKGFDIRGLYARSDIDDVARLNQVLGLSGNKTIGETMEGGYLQFGYNLLARSSERVKLMPYYRFEKVDTQDDVPFGFLKDPARNRTFNTLGLEFRPFFNVVIKGDYQWVDNRADSGVNQFNLVLGYNF